MHDVLIVGAGPAGSALAIHLARRGLDVLLLDRARFPRPKACGECLSPAGVVALERLGICDDVGTLDSSSIHGVRVVSYGGQAFEARTPPPGGLSVRRELLDNLLRRHAELAGSQVMEGVTVTGLDVDSRSATVRGMDRTGTTATWTARLAVGADGANSRIARLAGLAGPAGRAASIGCVWHLEGGSPLPATVEMHLGHVAYCGLAPVGRGLSTLGMVVDPHTLHRLGRRPEAALQSLTSELPALRSRLAGTVPVGPVHTQGFRCGRRRRVARRRVLLVGDAAAVSDPFTGQGVGLALISAERSAQAVADALARDDLSAEVLQRGTEDRMTVLRYRLTAAIGWVLRRPWMMERAAAQFDALPDLADLLIAVTGGMVPPERVLSPLFAMRLATGGW